MAAKPAPAAANIAQAAVKPAAKAASSKPAKPKKLAKKSSKKKKQVAGAKSKLKSGRAALTPMELIDQNQLAVDHLAGAESKSPLDLLASYKVTVEEGDLETAAVLLRLAANETPTHALVTTVNDLLGIALDTQDTEVLIEIAHASRADTIAKDVAGKEAAEAASPMTSRISAAHAAISNAPRGTRLESLVAYKQAVVDQNAGAAAFALGAILEKPLDAEAVGKANALLGIESVLTAQIVAQGTAVR